MAATEPGEAEILHLEAAFREAVAYGKRTAGLDGEVGLVTGAGG